MNNKNKALFWLLLLFLASCSTFSVINFENFYGPSYPRNREVSLVPEHQVDYWSEVKPIVENRCTVCHACYDAPCQFKSGSLQGIFRGASKTKVYNATRLTSAKPSRLFQDADTPTQWRESGFFPVINEHEQLPEANREASLIYQVLMLKKHNPLPANSVLDDSFTLGLNREQQCPQAGEFNQYAAEKPLWGMPYALPGLSEKEHNILTSWIEQGAVHTKKPALSASLVKLVNRWESFFNGSSNKEQLFTRYIYEHLFNASLYFDELNHRQYFRMVRSSTPPGEPIKQIVTRRPYDPPGVERVFYRLQEKYGSVADKNHMPYVLNKKRMNLWTKLFITPSYQVEQLPSYQVKVASNPFVVFAALPEMSRYHFMLEEAEFTIMGFIKGPVCRGQVALDVIDDHFWVFFVAPEEYDKRDTEAFFKSQQENLTLPASDENIYLPVTHWMKYAGKQKKYLEARNKFVKSYFKNGKKIGLDLIWNGEGVNPNAVLTVFRHFDSATVKKGLLGQAPKTAWVIGYQLLERIHYLLVAGYDVYGNVGHQLITRMYMDFMRMEGETAFLFLLPEKERNAIRNFWYRDAESEAKKYIILPRFYSNSENTIQYQSDDVQLELFQKLKARLYPVLEKEGWRQFSPQEKELAQLLEQLKSVAVNQLPEVSILEIKTGDNSNYITLLSNRGHLNTTAILKEQDNLLPEEDYLTVLPGIIGSYPNVFFSVESAQLGEFVNQVTQINSADDYRRLVTDYGVRRTNPGFWKHSDKVQQYHQKTQPVSAGILDYNRLENR